MRLPIDRSLVVAPLSFGAGGALLSGSVTVGLIAGVAAFLAMELIALVGLGLAKLCRAPGLRDRGVLESFWTLTRGQSR